MYVCVITSAVGASGEVRGIVVGDADLVATANHLQRLQRIPASVIDACGVLSCLSDTSGCALVPLAAADFEHWLRTRQLLSRGALRTLASNELLRATQARCQRFQTRKKSLC